MSAEPSGKRFAGLALVAVMVFGTLVARLWFLQVMMAPEFEAFTIQNRTRDIWVESPRGRIIDVNGKILADRRESLVVTMDWVTLQDLESEERAVIFERVASSLNREGIKTKQSTLETAFGRAQNDGILKSAVIAEDIDVRTWVTISESLLPGFDVERRWVRSYPYGQVGAHLLGYTGVVSSQDRAAELNTDNGEQHYLAGDEIGVAGLEQAFESTLRGTPQKLRVEIDARNRIVRTAEVLQEGSFGEDIYLTLDIDLQYTAEVILEEQLRLARNREACEVTCTHAHVAQAGSLVALDVTDGSVVALASYPTFDPSDFTFGISSEQFNFLREREDQPLFDRATRGAYAPGSTFKPVTAYAGLQSGVRGEFYPWNDEGVYVLESCKVEGASWCEFQNAGRAALGTVDLRIAIEKSSDTYFYSIGEQFWINPDKYGENSIQETAELMGFGQPTGIQLPLEKAGHVPRAETQKERFGDAADDWRTGDTVNLAIGQGYMEATPLQLANAYAMLATGGDRYQPRLVDRAADAEGNTTIEYRTIQTAEQALDPVLLQPIMDGLYAVPRTGTASKAFAGFPLDSIRLGGKTGTAQKTGFADFALYAGFGPRERPKYSVVAVLEEAGFGGDAAAPAVRQFMDVLFGLSPALEAPIIHDSPYQQGAPTISAAIADAAADKAAALASMAINDDQDSDSEEAPEAETTTTSRITATTETQPTTTTTAQDNDGTLTTTTGPATETTATTTPPPSDPEPSTTDGTTLTTVAAEQPPPTEDQNTTAPAEGDVVG